MEVGTFSTNGLVDPKDPLEYEKISISVGNDSEWHSCSLDIIMKKKKNGDGKEETKKEKQVNQMMLLNDSNFWNIYEHGHQQQYWFM